MSSAVCPLSPSLRPPHTPLLLSLLVLPNVRKRHFSRPFPWSRLLTAEARKVSFHRSKGGYSFFSLAFEQVPKYPTSCSGEQKDFLKFSLSVFGCPRDARDINLAEARRSMRRVTPASTDRQRSASETKVASLLLSVGRLPPPVRCPKVAKLPRQPWGQSYRYDATKVKLAL